MGYAKTEVKLLSRSKGDPTVIHVTIVKFNWIPVVLKTEQIFIEGRRFVADAKNSSLFQSSESC